LFQNFPDSLIEKKIKKITWKNGDVRLQTQTISFIIPNNVNFITKIFIHNIEYMCMCTICLSKNEKIGDENA
jgi:hypothetical protein